MLCILMVSFQAVLAQELPAPDLEIQVWPGPAPGSEAWDWQENTALSGNGGPMVQNVVRPVLLFYPADPALANGTAMIVAPGGGFVNLMMSYEGVDIALRLNKMGVHAFVLKYRLLHIDPDHPGQRPENQPRGMGWLSKQAGQNILEMSSADGQQAVRLLRSRAKELDIIPDRIGIMGFSAGGYVTAATLMGPADARPDFGAPIYAAVGNMFQLPIAVPENAPPIFVATAADDQTIPYQRSLDLFTAWQEAGYPAELHIFQTGRHGFTKKGGGADSFMDRLEEWLRVNGLLSK